MQEQFRKLCGETKTTGLDVRQLAEVFCAVPVEALPMPPADLAYVLREASKCGRARNSQRYHFLVQDQAL